MKTVPFYFVLQIAPLFAYLNSSASYGRKQGFQTKNEDLQKNLDF